MTDRTDLLSRRRYTLATLLAITYLIGEISSLTFISELTGLNETVLAGIETITLIMMISLVIICGWMYIRAKSRESATVSALNDELSVHHAKAAAIFAYKFVFFLSFVLFIMTKKMTLNAEDVARTIFASCLVVLYLRFAYLEIKNG